MAFLVWNRHPAYLKDSLLKSHEHYCLNLTHHVQGTR